MSAENADEISSRLARAIEALEQGDHDEIIRLRAELRAFDRLSDERRTAAQRALDTLEKVSADQRAQANEWRGTVNDIAEKKVDRTAFTAFQDSVDRRFKPIETFQARALGFGALLALVSAAIGAAIAKII